MNNWLELDSISSRGSQADKAGSLGALHEKRKETLSQFFTPEWVVKFAWNSLSPSFKNGSNYALFDNSIGTASMFRFADPSKFSISGYDIDANIIGAVSEFLESSGFQTDIKHASLENAIPNKYSASIINPPFSITLNSPYLTPYPGITHYGKFGPNSSALSHEYALAQALDCSSIVVAVVPSSTTSKLKYLACTYRRLRAIYSLPSETFMSENVSNVSTDLLIFGGELTEKESLISENLRIVTKTINKNSTPDNLFKIKAIEKSFNTLKGISVIGVDESSPVVTMPVSNDKRVILNRSGRNISLKFFCGATEGKVKNALYRDRLYSSHQHRYPKATKYSGQHQLNIDTIILQDNPFEALNSVTDTIKRAGGLPVVTRDLLGGIKALINKHKIMSTPFGRTAYRKGAPVISATAKKTALLNRKQRGAVVSIGDQVTAQRTQSGFLLTTPNGLFDCDHDLFFSVFEMSEQVSNSGYWEQIHPPLKDTFPKQIKSLESKALSLNLDKFLSWDFQMEDLLEVAIRPYGCIVGWQMALGKTRLALALSLLLSGDSLLVVKSRLVDEMIRELTSLGVNPDLFQIIRVPSQARNLKKINIISYERLKNPVNSSTPKLNIAKMLRGKIKNVIADEGGLLSNNDSIQSKALWAINAKRKYIFDGTPCANYPREMLPLAAWAIGEEVSYQPYSLKSGYIDKRLFNSSKGQTTGRNEFLDRFICFEWATNEFLDTGKGAKREVPKIKQTGLSDFRTWNSTLIKRRVQQEPAVAKNVSFPVPTLNNPTLVEWDFDHLCLYVQVVEDFATWYRKYASHQQQKGNAINLTMVLARLEACFKAANVPSKVKGYAQPFTNLTSKEIATIDLIIDEVAKGRRPIVFARNPIVLNRLQVELERHNISSLVFTGEETIDKRIKKLNSHIRNGDTQVMLASIGVTQDGLNLHQLNTFIFYSRSYKAREEFQAIYRLIRPLQKDDVYGYFMHLDGSIDCYMAQLIEWKSLASEAGLDYGEQPEDETFLHFDSFIHSFLSSLPGLRERIKEQRSRLFGQNHSVTLLSA